MDKNNRPYIDQEEQENFERFLMGAMDENQRRRFQERLDSDSELALHFAEFKQLFQSVEESALRESLDSFHASLDPPAQKSKGFVSMLRHYRIAAGIAILLGVGLWYFTRTSPEAALYNEYFRPDPGLPTVMGSSDQYSFYEAMVDYKRGNYDLAIEKWGQLAASKPDNDTLNYFLGMAHMANQQETRAIPFLEAVSGNKGSEFLSETYFYLALAYLKQGRLEAAQAVLKQSDTPVSKELEDRIQKF